MHGTRTGRSGHVGGRAADGDGHACRGHARNLAGVGTRTCEARRDPDRAARASWSASSTGRTSRAAHCPHLGPNGEVPGQRRCPCTVSKVPSTPNYTPRLLDTYLSVQLHAFSAVLVNGPRATGNTTAAVTWIDSYLEQLLTRDTYSVVGERDRQKLEAYFRAVAAMSAGLVRLVPYDELLADLFVVEEVPAWAANHLDRLIRTAKRSAVDPALMGAALGVEVETILDSGTNIARREAHVLAAGQEPGPLRCWGDLPHRTRRDRLSVGCIGLCAGKSGQRRPKTERDPPQRASDLACTWQPVRDSNPCRHLERVVS
jgi:hypothetical protein